MTTRPSKVGASLDSYIYRGRVVLVRRLAALQSAASLLQSAPAVSSCKLGGNRPVAVQTKRDQEIGAKRHAVASKKPTRYTVDFIASAFARADQVGAQIVSTKTENRGQV